MLIGQDFEKIEFDFLGYNFLEPNALYGDTIVAILAVYCAVICSRYYKQTQLIFFKHWKHFFYVFGIGFLLRSDVAAYVIDIGNIKAKHQWTG